MSDLTIITNNVPRDIIDAWELSEKERKEFDYLDWDKIEKGEDSASFFRYKGQLYDMSELQGIPASETVPDNSQFQHFSGWHAYSNDTFFSGILMKYVGDEQVLVGRFYS